MYISKPDFLIIGENVCDFCSLGGFHVVQDKDYQVNFFRPHGKEAFTTLNTKSNMFGIVANSGDEFSVIISEKTDGALVDTNKDKVFIFSFRVIKDGDGAAIIRLDGKSTVEYLSSLEPCLYVSDKFSGFRESVIKAGGKEVSFKEDMFFKYLH